MLVYPVCNFIQRPEFGHV